VRIQFTKSKINFLLFILLVAFCLSSLFLWWWNPKLLNPISDEEFITIWSSGFNNTEIATGLKNKMPINLEECKRGDKRYVFHGMGSKTSVVLMNMQSKCMLKEYLDVENAQSVFLCLVPKSEKELNIFTSPVMDVFVKEYCMKLPPYF
jgi:hypothetical protein